MHACTRAAWLAAACAAGSAQAQEGRDYYLYQRSALPQDLHVDFESATGSRDAGVFGRHGVEGLIRSGATVGEHWALELAAGYAQNRDTDESGTAWSAEARYDWTTPEADWGLGLGAGYRRDYEAVGIPYVRLVGEHSMQRWHLASNLVLEAPQSDERDATDILVSLGASYATSATLRLGLELAGEDLEGFFEDEEAEGGAKFVLGPTLDWHAGANTWVRAHIGWIYAATANAPANPESVDYRGNRNGVLARVGLSFGR